MSPQAPPATVHSKRLEKELKNRFGPSLVPWPAVEKPSGGTLEPSVFARFDATWNGRDVTVYTVEDVPPPAPAVPQPPSSGVWTPWTGAKTALKLWQDPVIRGDPHHMTLLDSWADVSAMLLVFERVEPLRDLLATLCATELLLVINDAAQGVLQLHESCDVSHNAVAIASLAWTAKNGRRRTVVANLEFCMPMDEQLDRTLPRIRTYRAHLHPEEESSTAVTHRGAPVWARDSYSIAVIINSLVNHQSRHPALCDLVAWCEGASSGIVKQRGSYEASGLTSSFVMEHKAMLPPERPSVAKLLGLSVFRTCGLVKVCTGLDRKLPHAFFSSLHTYLPMLPYGVFKDVVLPCFHAEAFWKEASGISAFMPSLIGGSGCASCLDPGDRDALVDFMVNALRTTRALRTPMLRVIEHVLPVVDAETMLGTVLAVAVQAVEQRECHEEVYWGLHTVIAASRELLQRGDGVDADAQAKLTALLGAKVVPLLLQYTKNPRFTAKIRSTALLALVQLMSLEALVVEGTPESLLQALSATLLSGDDELCHHALNSVVMAESILPYRTLALELLPLTATVMLSPNPKLREKCMQVSSHVLNSLEEIDEPDCEEFASPPLFKGCPLAVALGEKDKKRLLKGRDKGGSFARTNDDTGTVPGGADTFAATCTSDVPSDDDAAMMDAAWNEERLLLVRGGGRVDLRPVVLLPAAADDLAKNERVTGKKKRGRTKKKARAAACDQPANEEDQELNLWEHATFDPEIGEAYSSLLVDASAVGRTATNTTDDLTEVGTAATSEASATPLHTSAVTPPGAPAKITGKKKKKKPSAVAVAAAADASTDGGGAGGGGFGSVQGDTTSQATSPPQSPSAKPKKKKKKKKQADDDGAGGLSPLIMLPTAASGGGDGGGAGEGDGGFDALLSMDGQFAPSVSAASSAQLSPPAPLAPADSTPFEAPLADRQHLFAADAPPAILSPSGVDIDQLLKDYGSPRFSDAGAQEDSGAAHSAAVAAQSVASSGLGSPTSPTPQSEATAQDCEAEEEVLPGGGGDAAVAEVVAAAPIKAKKKKKKKKKIADTSLEAADGDGASSPEVMNKDDSP